MKLIIDERENQVFDKIRQFFDAQPTPLTTVEIVKRVLPLGDFILEDASGSTVAIVERKSLSDLLASIKDGRYEEQSYRLANCSEFSPHQVIYIIEGSLSTLSHAKDRRLVYSAMTSLHFYKGFCPVRTYSTQETAEWLVWTADKIARNTQKGVPRFLTLVSPQHAEPTPLSGSGPAPASAPPAYCSVVKKVKKENITPQNIAEIMLCQIPGISAVTAVAIMKQYPSFYHLLEACKNDRHCLENLQYETNGKMRKINKSCIDNIFTYFFPGSPPPPDAH